MNKFGIITTIIYTGIVICFRWDSLPTLKTIGLNEFGDFFAGVFGPVAIFWLILGFHQQGKELKQSTEALRLQATELNNSVAQQKELVNVTNEQTGNSREEERINRTINEIENWLVIKRESQNDSFNRLNIHSVCNKIEWVKSIEEHEFKSYFKFDLLMKILKEQSTMGLLVDMQSSLDDEIQASLDTELRGYLDNYYEATAMGAQVATSEEVLRLVEAESLFDRINKIIVFIRDY